MDPHSSSHHIHIEQLDDDHDHIRYAYSSYSEDSLEFNDETGLDRLNRLSNTSTLVGGSSPPPSQHQQHPYLFNPSSTSTSSFFATDIKMSSSSSDSTLSEQPKRGLWYRLTHSESGRLACAFLYFFFVCIAMAFCNQLSDHRWVETAYTKVLLRDRGFDVIAAQADIQPANTFVMTSVVFTVLGIGMICPNWTTRAIVLRRILWVIGTLSVYRAMTLSVTTLPTPKEECRPSLKTGFWEMFIVALQMIPGTVEACTDDIFSGHTVFMVSCAIQWRLYCRNKWITYFSYLYISVGLYFVVATRLHYTVDVVLAVFITFAAWSLYIGMVDVVMEHEYFGIQSHHEKYAVFDSTIAEYEFIQEEDDEAIRNAGTATLRTRRRQLEHMMNRLRGPRIGYGQGEYDRVAFLPKQFNLWLKGLVRWCDGLDLRMRPLEGASKGTSRWEELVVRYRSEQVSGGDSRARMYRKMNEGVEDEVDEDTMVRSEMVQVYRAHECPEQQQQGRWRSLPLRLTSPRQRKASLKEEKDGKADRDSKWRVLKIAAIIIVNAILLIKIAQAIENGAPPPPPQHWTKDMESYSGGSINNGTIDAATVAPEYNQPQELRRGENQEHREQAYSAVIVEEEEGGEDHYRRRGDHHHMRRREVRHHKERSHVRDWEPEGAI